MARTSGFHINSIGDIDLKAFSKSRNTSRLVAIEEPCIFGRALGFEAVFVRLDRHGNRWEIAVRRIDDNGYLQAGGPREVVRDNRSDVQSWLKQLPKSAD